MLPALKASRSKGHESRKLVWDVPSHVALARTFQVSQASSHAVSTAASASGIFIAFRVGIWTSRDGTENGILGVSPTYVNTTPQMTRFRGAKVCSKWLQKELTITTYSLTTSTKVD